MLKLCLFADKSESLLPFQYRDSRLFHSFSYCTEISKGLQWPPSQGHLKGSCGHSTWPKELQEETCPDCCCFSKWFGHIFKCQFRLQTQLKLGSLLWLASRLAKTHLAYWVKISIRRNLYPNIRHIHFKMQSEIQTKICFLRHRNNRVLK